MVSLKSFKIISEEERDESVAGGLGDDQTNRQAASYQPQIYSIGSESSDRSSNGENQLMSHTSTQQQNESFNANLSSNNSTREMKGNDSCIKTTEELGRRSVEASKSIVKVTFPSGGHQVEAVGATTIDHKSVSPTASSISIVVVHHGNPPSTRTESTVEKWSTPGHSSNHSLNDLDDVEEIVRPQVVGSLPVPVVELGNNTYYTSSGEKINLNNNDMQLFAQAVKETDSRLTIPGSEDSRSSLAMEGDHFEIVWSNLSYKIAPKWYKRINFLDQIFSHILPGQTVDNHSSATSTASSSAGMNDNQHQMHTSTNGDHQNANAKPKSPSDPIEIFTNLNGTIKSGQMTAVLGPSAELKLANHESLSAGKTTLLNCLTGKLRKGVSGHINLLGANGKHLKMCTIPQKAPLDHLLELLTVEENLWFASKIKNPEYGFDHVKNIERVIDLLGLKRCRSAKIKKISGGQHKRVSIAQELLSNPDILVLDEPTSGLDSLTCYKTISMLRDLVELSANNDFMKPMAIIVTIHQPQPKVFNLFHHVYILANGGRVIYEGAPQLSLDTITNVTGLKPIDGSKASGLALANTVDPASFLIEIASEEYGLEPIKKLSDHQRRAFYETNFANYNDSSEHINNLSGGQFHLHGVSEAKVNHGFTPDFDTPIKQDLTTVFVPNHINTKTTKENSNVYEKHNKISEGVDSPKSSKKNRKKLNYSLGSRVSSSRFSGRSGDTNRSASASSSHSGSLYMSEQLLYTREANHRGRFWAHTRALTHRTLLTIRRDPLLMTSRILFHLMIPILMGHVYGKETGAANACPHYEPEIDITQIPSLVEGKRIEYMLEELHMSIENVSMFFITMYAFAAAVLALNALSFPLNMQVLLKETRNGWYSMSSYVLAKTLADLPLELMMPCLTMAMVYPLTGQPSSYLEWRMLTICLIMTLCSLIAQTQALILGALVMNSVQTAVFVSQASQLPWVILAGFTIRIKRLSEPLKLVSLTSFYRLGCEAITLARYGFGICACDPKEITGEPVKLVGIPDQLRSVAQYWMDSIESSKENNGTEDSTGMTTTLAPITGGSAKNDIFQNLANQLSYANSYGVNITSCQDVTPDRIRAINLGDNWLVARIWHLFIMLIIMKILLYYAVKFSIGIRL